MTLNDLAKELTRREGKKKQVNIADMRETLGHLSDILYEADKSAGIGGVCRVVLPLIENGRKRSKKK